MSFRHVAVPKDKFDLVTVKRLQDVFDEICSERQLAIEDPRRGRLASALVELAGKGELENLRLKVRALF